MKALIQRVRQARVEVAGEIVGAIDQGLLVLVGIEREDDRARASFCTSCCATGCSPTPRAG